MITKSEFKREINKLTRGYINSLAFAEVKVALSKVDTIIEVIHGDNSTKVKFEIDNQVISKDSLLILIREQVKYNVHNSRGRLNK